MRRRTHPVIVFLRCLFVLAILVSILNAVMDRARFRKTLATVYITAVYENGKPCKDLICTYREGKYQNPISKPTNAWGKTSFNFVKKTNENINFVFDEKRKFASVDPPTVHFDKIEEKKEISVTVRER